MKLAIIAAILALSTVAATTTKPPTPDPAPVEECHWEWRTNAAGWPVLVLVCTTIY